MRNKLFLVTFTVMFVLSSVLASAPATPALAAGTGCNNGTPSDTSTPGTLTVTAASSQNGLVLSVAPSTYFSEFSKPTVSVSFQWWENWYTRKDSGTVITSAVGSYTMTTFPAYLTAKNVHSMSLVYGGRWYYPDSYANADSYTFNMVRGCLP